MNAHASPIRASIIPTVRYRDVSAAVVWLQDAFAFEVHRLVHDTKGSVLYAELTFGSGMVMIAPIQESPLGKLMVQPGEIGGVETQICYLFVDDTKAHYARAKAAGAEIVLDIKAESNGGRGYSCRDLEGHVWNFGTHNPWKLVSGNERRPRRAWKAIAACLLLAAAIGFLVHQPAREAAGDLAVAVLDKVSTSIDPALAAQTPDLAAGGPAEEALRELREQLARERLARVAADRHVKDIREQLVRERSARETAEMAARAAPEAPMQTASAPTAALKAAEAAAAEARGDLAKLRATLQSANEQLTLAQKAKDAAERGAKEAREQFAQLRNAREDAEETARDARELAARERSARIAAQRTLRKAKESPYTPYPLN